MVGKLPGDSNSGWRGQQGKCSHGACCGQPCACQHRLAAQPESPHLKGPSARLLGNMGTTPVGRYIDLVRAWWGQGGGMGSVGVVRQQQYLHINARSAIVQLATGADKRSAASKIMCRADIKCIRACNQLPLPPSRTSASLASSEPGATQREGSAMCTHTCEVGRADAWGGVRKRGGGSRHGKLYMLHPQSR